MSIVRDDRWVADALGRALPGTQVYWCTQPASTGSNPPSPLATIYSDSGGTTPVTQPVVADGFGHAFAYMDDSVLYTVVFWHPLFGTSPIVQTDQSLPGGGSGGSALTPFEGIPSGTIDGSNKVFTLTNAGTPIGGSPTQVTVWLNYPLIPGLGYTISGNQITFASAPQAASGGVAGDSIYARGFLTA